MFDPRQPAVSEQRLRATLASAQGHEALAMQLALERDGDDAGDPDRHVAEELALLYRALGDEARARHCADRRAALGR